MKKASQPIQKKARCTTNKISRLLRDKRGELATNTIGGIIVGVVVIGLLILAVNSFFPSFFSSMFEKMAEKLNANW